MITSYFQRRKQPERTSTRTPDATTISSTSNSDALTTDSVPSTESAKAEFDTERDDDSVKRRARKSSQLDDDAALSIPPEPKRVKAAPSQDLAELLKHLTEPSWRLALERHVTSPGFNRLAQFAAKERLTKTVYPSQNDTFAALNHTPLSKVKVVVVGQDPYHQPQQGHGLAFSVQKGIKIPPSLRNIYKELRTNYPDEFQIPQHGHLIRWAQQGVLLLNSVLTVQRDKPNSHAKKGWEEFTNEILRILHKTPREHGLVLLLWGKPASLKAQTVFQNKNGPHTVIITSHPSPLGATKTNSPFITSQCFRKANDALVKMGETPIDWNVDEPAVPKESPVTSKATTKDKYVAECDV